MSIELTGGDGEKKDGGGDEEDPEVMTNSFVDSISFMLLSKAVDGDLFVR